MVTANELRQQHKQLKKKVDEAEGTRQHIRDWRTKEELVNLKKEKLLMKDKLNHTKPKERYKNEKTNMGNI